MAAKIGDGLVAFKQCAGFRLQVGLPQYAQSRCVAKAGMASYFRMFTKSLFRLVTDPPAVWRKVEKELRAFSARLT